ncbi:MAG: methylated-DNA--[protein]-cysteine S-methyltransferase [Candidatus Omnitrophica bacterium]|nr:methylated-DNA--[protein]-cysteine S-methyltransferase [Candidatus Omnitrophota bacterium]MCM8806809.1 methylated-DNA--[protein]-cysteine S-methyltransferase [Candidatus Omnitrophota bacterium]
MRKQNKNTIKKKLWQVLLKIPIGQTKSYSEISKKLGLEKKVRFISKLLKENPYPISIPCHRVIHKNGKIGKYLYGSDFKKFLIEWEKFFV